MMIKIPYVLFCCLLILTMACPCRADIIENQSELAQIRARIEKAETALKNKQQSELDISRELALIKRTLQRIDQRIDDLKKDQKQLRGEIDRQQQVIKDGQKNVSHIGQRLEKRLVALYKEGEAGSLKILFSADSPTEMVQQYHYLTRILQYDKDLLAEYKAAVIKQQQQLDTLESLEKQKREFLQKEQQQRQIASEGRSLQTRLLKQARTDKNKLSAELAQLKEKAARLKALISRLETEEPPDSTSSPVTGSFAGGRGTLGWPLKGEVVIGFGTQKDDNLGTYFESNGIEIAARPGSPIRAVASGKVVFADYFKGYGNLFILSHPGGYHTLYAQTDRMQKKLGDQISAGDLLGYSGLAGRGSIYFEIRSKGSPVNPLGWLERQ